MAPTVSSSASLEQFVLSPSPGDPAVPAPELSDWLEKSLFHFHTSFSDPSVSMYPELTFRDSNNFIRWVFDVTTPGTLWVYRSLHRALRLLRAWAEEGAGVAQKKHLCPPEIFVEGIHWYINEAVPAVFATPLETVPTILLERRAVIALALFFKCSIVREPKPGEPFRIQKYEILKKARFKN